MMTMNRRMIWITALLLAALLLAGCTALLVAAVPAVAFASSTSTKGTTVYRVKTSGGNLNVRAKASVTAKVVTDEFSRIIVANGGGLRGAAEESGPDPITGYNTIEE